MKHFLQKAFLFLLGGVLCSLSVTAQNTKTVGAEDNTTELWTVYSDGYDIKTDETLHLEFTNYTGGAENWHNFVIDLRNSAGATLAILRADNFGWGVCYYGGLNDCNYDWNNFKTLMNGAKVSLDIIRKSKVVEVKAEITGSDNNAYHQYYYLGVPDADATIQAYLTTEKGHLVINNDKTAVSNTEYSNPDAEGFTYTNDFTSTTGLEIVGNGSFVDDEVFGKAFKNATGGKRTNYLMLPGDLFAHSLYSQQLTIGFWVNSADAGASTDYMWAPIFTAYETTTAGQDNGAPMFSCQYRGVLQANCFGWCDYVDAQNTNGTNVLYHGDTDWLADKGWHYYTLVLDGDNAKVYFDGELKNEWNANTEYDKSETEHISGTSQRGLFFKGDILKKICLGGNQAWGWGDNDPGFKFAKFLATNKAMSSVDIKEQMLADMPAEQEGLVGNEDNTTDWMGDFSEIYPIEAGKTLHLEFTNYHKNGAKEWNNWVLFISNLAEGHSKNVESPYYKEGYNEYFVVRCDNFGWGDFWNTGGNQSDCDWSADIMNGALVSMDIIRRGPVVFVTAEITGTDNKKYYQQSICDIRESEATIYASLTVDGSHLIIDDTKTATTESTTEAAGEWIYTNDFSSLDGLQIIGSGEIVEDAYFGHAFKNAASTNETARTNYLLMPSDLLSHSVTSEQLTIGFWVKQHGDYSWASPIFNAYANAPAEGKNTVPMFNCPWRGLLQANVGRGWSDYTDAQNVKGKNTQYYDGELNWVAGGGWHYYTVVLDGENAKVYVDGILKNEWNMDGTVNTQKGLFYTGSYLKYICLGGNQAWDWQDMDPGFSYAKFLATNKAMTADEIEAQMQSDLPEIPEGTVGKIDNSTDRLGDFSEALIFEEDQMATFEFTNYSDKIDNWHNWIACVSSGEAFNAENLLMALRADNFEEVQDANTGIANNYNWDTFKDDMHESNVVLTIKYKNGRLITRAKITTKDGEKEYFEEFVKGGIEGKVTACMSVFLSHLIISKAEVSALPDNPENYVGYEDNTSIYLEEFSDILTLTKGKIATFEFTNHSDKIENWHNWVACVGGETFDAAALNVALRADGWENIQASAEGVTSDFDFSKDDMDGATVAVKVTYKEGKAIIHADITTVAENKYSVEYTKEGLSGTITAAMSIDHAHLVMTKAEITDDPASGISTIDAQNATQNAPMFDLSGRRVDASYKGIVIKNGKKMIVK